MSKIFSIPSSVFLIVFFLVLPNLVLADESDKVGRFAWGMSTSWGSFQLDGNEGGNELLSTGRSSNKTGEAESYGLGLVGAYRLTTNIQLDVALDATWAYESLEDAYTINHLDLGAKYLFDLGGISPFVGGGYTKMDVKGLEVYDATATSAGKKYDYDFTGHGFYYTLGFDMNFSETLAYSLGYNKSVLFNFASDEGGVEFDNTPSASRYFFNFKIWF